ncbi:hypothetical protein UM590_01650 [Staphylococcus aureus]|nr:hypothetical protein UM590_01650 [Staphylococcus aureus]
MPVGNEVRRHRGKRSHSYEIPDNYRTAEEYSQLKIIVLLFFRDLRPTPFIFDEFGEFIDIHIIQTATKIVDFGRHYLALKNLH